MRDRRSEWPYPDPKNWEEALADSRWMKEHPRDPAEVAAYEAELAERRRLRADDARLAAAIAQMKSASPVGRIKHWLKVAGVVAVVIWLFFALMGHESCTDAADRVNGDIEECIQSRGLDGPPM